MSAGSRSIEISEDLYRLIEKRAKASHRTIEEELAGLVKAMMPEDEAAFRREFDAMDSLDDAALRRAALKTLSDPEGKRIRNLHKKRNEKGLTDAEQTSLDALMKKYERTMLTKAKAFALLRERGHDISKLIKKAS